MHRRAAIIGLIAALASSPAVPGPAWARGGSRYDVSYLWHTNLGSVRSYRRAVVRVLGPGIRSKLRVVKGNRLYGLIYDRDGPPRSTWEVARRHSRLLTRRGLEPAAPIRSRAWRFLGEEDPLRPPRLSGSLENRVETYIKHLRRRGVLRRDESTAWSVYDLSSGRKLVSINEDRPMQAASMVKPFFAMAFMHKVRAGELRYGPKERRMLEAMIQRSSNKATNRVLKKLGGPKKVNSLLRRRYHGIFRDTKIVEYIPSGGRTYRNRASAHDYSRFLYALWRGHLPGSSELKRLMSLPNRDRLNTGAREIPAGTRVYNKTGSTSRLCGDMGILQVRGRDGKRYAYTLIGVIEKRRPVGDYTRWIESRGNVIREVSNLVYRDMRGRHDGVRTARR